MRLFVALPLPEPMRMHLAGVGTSLRGELRTVRWVRPENLHITLKFLGDVPDTCVPAVRDALVAVPSRGTSTVHAARLALKPNLIVAEFGGDAARVAALAGEIEAAVEPLGFPREHRAFWPHATLGRSRERIRGQADELVRHSKWPGPQGVVDRFELMQSELRPQGPRYTVIASFPLAKEMP